MKKFDFIENLKKAQLIFNTSRIQGKSIEQIVDDLVDRGFEREWAEKKVAGYLAQTGEEWRKM